MLSIEIADPLLFSPFADRRQVEQKQDWSDQMLELILTLKKSIDWAIDQGKTQVNYVTIKDCQQQYYQILQRGNSANPFISRGLQSASQTKRTRVQNLSLFLLQNRFFSLIQGCPAE